MKQDLWNYLISIALALFTFYTLFEEQPQLAIALGTAFTLVWAYLMRVDQNLRALKLQNDAIIEMNKRTIDLNLLIFKGLNLHED